MRVVIVDDEPVARRGIRARLAPMDGIEIVGECGNGREAVLAIRESDPDLVFLDVQMPGLDGFEVVGEIGPERMPVVIFVTAHDAHAMQAFDVHALDYILKPIDQLRFERAVERARRRIGEREEGMLARRLGALLSEHGYHAAETPSPVAAQRRDGRLLVKDRGRIVILEQDEINWVEAEGDYVRVHVIGRGYLVRETMSAMEGRLDTTRFVRIHRSTIVNTSRVRELAPQPNREFTLVLRDGVRLRSSRTYYERLRAALGDAL